MLNPNFLLLHRNRYSKGTDDGQKTSNRHPNFNSYVQNLRFFIFQTDLQTEGWTEKLIRCGLGTLSVPPGTPTARGLEEHFSIVLDCDFFRKYTDTQIRIGRCAKVLPLHTKENHLNFFICVYLFCNIVFSLCRYADTHTT